MNSYSNKDKQYINIINYISIYGNLSIDQDSLVMVILLILMSPHRFKFRDKLKKFNKFKKAFKKLNREEKLKQIKDFFEKMKPLIEFLTSAMIENRLFSLYLFQLNSLKQFLSSEILSDLSIKNLSKFLKKLNNIISGIFFVFLTNYITNYLVSFLFRKDNFILTIYKYCFNFALFNLVLLFLFWFHLGWDHLAWKDWYYIIYNYLVVLFLLRLWILRFLFRKSILDNAFRREFSIDELMPKNIEYKPSTQIKMRNFKIENNQELHLLSERFGIQIPVMEENDKNVAVPNRRRLLTKKIFKKIFNEKNRNRQTLVQFIQIH